MKCPGQDSRYWKTSAIFEAPCPKCKAPVEFFKDDPARKCPSCGHRFVNPNMDFGCASYCEYAGQCLGSMPAELIAQKESLLKDRVAIEIKKYYQTDFKRIGAAMRVARYAENIGKTEGANLAVVLPAAYLNGAGGHEDETLALARTMLKRLGARDTLIEDVCALLSCANTNGHAKNFDVLQDALLIVDLEDRQKRDQVSTEKMKALIETNCRTDGGRHEAEKILVRTS